ncbi:DegT/DnrJ/EryC1/StrS family aminotransferase [Micromonospora sp. WMMD882]|uniref:DegT/DnrJ/EryC1/StrS family aminotransferase n=1 Tax=Micromonospora sp. WMMD882 TaxID=3015151 RepID=UPI00248BF0DA|nr:DegT/DnrJ/EryC1/StrS family aminotransferase [Micromonospora sp. WMMD882]WBB78708.1 DegT/DnrJ/EryC1/StrS family aminotransferase [Micromonospora sp. WMMD882]
MINISQPDLGAEELDAVREVFASNWLGYGPLTRAFETEFGEFLDVPAEHLIFLNSATSGLFLATELLGLGPGDDVVLPSVSFVAAANAIAATGARPVFCDVDPRTLNPSVGDVERAITPRTRAVLILHYGGQPGDVKAIAAHCAARGIPLIEDVSVSIASAIDDRRCGTFGDIATWSFDSRKVITTGDGGMLYVRDAALSRRAKRMAYHGVADRSAFTTASRVARRWWELDVQEVGRRLIGNDLTAAIGRVQLRRLPAFVERRRVITEMYHSLLGGIEGIRLSPPLPRGHATTHYFYYVQLDPGIRDQVAEDLLARGIYTTFRYEPLHTVPLYRADGVFPGTALAAATTLLLPIHQGLDDTDVHTVAEELIKAVEHRSAPTRP